jgi:ABC-type phosphate/phosphonate transport system substrate-binding protein
MSWRSWISSTLVCLLALGLLAGARATSPTPIRIGMVQTFFTDVPRVMVDIATEPFAAVMREATGLGGQLVVGGDAFEVAEKLQVGDLHLAVFHGFEFAWVRQKHPELKPLTIAVNKHHQVQAFVLTRKDSPATTFADLKGKDVSLPRRSREHCRLYLRQRSHDAGQCTPQVFFKQVIASTNVETALDDLVDGKHDAAVVDSLGIEFYRDLKPGCFARFKVMQESERFPPAVIAYKDGVLDDATLRRLCDGLRNANNLDLGREMMKMWKIHSFDAVPPSYDESLTEILKAYPTPLPAAKVSQR